MTSDRDCFADSQRVRTAARQFRLRLGEDAEHPACTLTEPRFGYRMEKGRGRVLREIEEVSTTRPR